MSFENRRDAGRKLAGRLVGLRGADVVVLGLPRGGVPVAAEVADALGAPLDVLLVRKIGLPSHPELAMGAIGEGGVRIVNEDIVRRARVGDREWMSVEERERAVLADRARLFRAGRPPQSLAGKTAVLVDDGIATGATAQAACQVARAQGAERVVVATPVASPSSIVALEAVADAVVCLEAPPSFGAVGSWYQDFSPTSDAEVVDILDRSRVRRPERPEPVPRAAGAQAEVEVSVGALGLPGRLTVPYQARSIVVFAHGSGSSRHSVRNRAVAEMLNRAGLATLLFDLLTPSEARDRTNVFDIELLGQRLIDVTRWLLGDSPATRDMGIAYFGASTGAGAALWAAAEPGIAIEAVVSRGGRPDLAGARLSSVRAPTLLIVGGHDGQVLELNRQAALQLCCEHRIAIVPGATHLFEEPGTLEQASRLALGWFVDHARRPSGSQEVA